MLDGATPALILLLLFWLISIGGFFCLFHVDDPCLKIYPLTIVHPTLPCKHILVIFLFRRFLLMEGSQSLNIVSLIICLVLFVVKCFSLQELFGGCSFFNLYQIEQLFPKYLEPKDGDRRNALDHIV